MKDDKKIIEIRTVNCQLAVREAAKGAQGESRTITGRAIVFNQESQELDDWGERFIEVILPEACTDDWLRTQDVKMNLLHDRQLTVARCNKGQGTMKLEVDSEGVTFEFEAPKCDIGDRCLEMVRRGDYSGCSFEFYPQDYEKEVDGDLVTIRHKKFAALLALTIGMDPAYIQTSVNARELAKGNQDDQAKREEDENTKRAAEEQARMDRENREREAAQIRKAIDEEMYY